MVLFSLQVAVAQSVELPENPIDNRAQHRSLQFERLSIQEGLMQRSASALKQDRHGFMWIGTQDGIDRFDGYGFKSFKYDPDDDTTIQSGFVNDIIEDSAGDLWVATNHGLSRYDPINESFERFVDDNEIWEITEGQKGELWIANIQSGLYKLDVETGTLTPPEDLFDGAFADRHVSSVGMRSNGDLWIGTAESGAFLLQRGSDELTHFPSGENGLGYGPVLCLYEDSREQMWLGTWGLNLWNPDTKQFQNFLPDPSTEVPIGQLNSNENLVSSILEDDNEILWVGMGFGHGSPEGGGIAEFDQSNESFYLYRHDPKISTSIGNDNVFDLEKDENGNVWVGTATEGVSRFDAMLKSFSLYSRSPSQELPYLRGGSARGIVVDSHEVLWIIMTDGILNRVDRNEGTHEFFDLESANLPFLLEEEGGLLLACSPVGNCRLFDPESRKVIKMLNPENRLGGMFQDRSGKIYRGLDIYDSKTQKFVATDVKEEFFQILTEDQKGQLWFTSWDKILRRYVPDTGEIEVYPDVSAGWAMVERKEEPGVLWMTHIGTGLSRYDTESKTMSRFSEQNSGLINNTIYGIFDDDSGNLWMSSNDGIIKFNPDSNTFHSFGVGNGLQSQEFDANSHYRSRSGEIFFGGANGVNGFFPEQIEVDQVAPEVVLTGIRLFNQLIQPGPDSPTIVSFSETTKMELGYEENDLTFEYVGIQFDRPEKIQYAYKLDNYDDDWRFVGSQRKATYTSLDPGSYTFRVKAANADGFWEDEALSLEVIISPPWWRTLWAYILFGLGFGLCVFGVDRFQRARLIRKERAKAHLLSKELRAQAAEASADLLKSENMRQTQELDSARDLQLSMLPSTLPQIPDLQIKAFMKTAVEVGGDYYDFEVDAEGALTCAIGDATGHGAKAGTMVTAMKSLWSAYSSEEDLTSILQKSHKALRKLGLPQLYMSLALARVAGNKLELVGAGLPDALLFKAKTGEVDRISLKGIPLGGPHDMPFASTIRDLDSGDTLLLMTDGFPELFNEQGEMLGYEVVVDKFAEVVMRSAEEIIEKLKSDCVKWSGSRPLDDDVTFLVLKKV